MRLLRKNTRWLDPEEQELRGLWGQSFGTGTSFGGGGWNNCGTKTFAEKMNGAGGEWGNRLTLFATGLLACSGSAFGSEGAKRNAGGINRKCGGAGFRTGDGGAGKFMCACGGLGASGAMVSAFKGGECGWLTKFNCPGMLDLRGNWWFNCKPSKCLVAWDSCQAVFGAFSWVDIPKFIGVDGYVYWGCRCSCMMLFATCAFLVTLSQLLGIYGSWTGRLMLASIWPCVLRLECEFGSWVEGLAYLQQLLG